MPLDTKKVHPTTQRLALDHFAIDSLRTSEAHLKKSHLYVGSTSSRGRLLLPISYPGPTGLLCVHFACHFLATPPVIGRTRHKTSCERLDWSWVLERKTVCPILRSRPGTRYGFSHCQKKGSSRDPVKRGREEVELEAKCPTTPPIESQPPLS